MLFCDCLIPELIFLLICVKTVSNFSCSALQSADPHNSSYNQTVTSQFFFFCCSVLLLALRSWTQSKGNVTLKKKQVEILAECRQWNYYGSSYDPTN